MHLGLLQDPNGQPRAEGTRLVTEGVKGRDGFEFPSRREARGVSDKSRGVNRRMSRRVASRAT